MREFRFRAMGSDAHLIVVGGAPGLAKQACRRIEDLERRWSRFLPSSEVSQLNRYAGSWLEVSPETVLLVERSIEAWWRTGSGFDPTVLGALIRAGYDRPFEELDPAGTPTSSPLLMGCTDIEVAATAVRLPTGTGFDPGGIGKGLAADIVAAETLDAGAGGVCVNLGGDLRVAGTPPVGEAWTVAIEHPARPSEPLALVGLAEGAVATSTTLRRRWLHDGEVHHHLIDPATARPSETDLDLVSVIAGDGWEAEVLAKAILLRGSRHPFDLVDGTGAEALAVGRDGSLSMSDGFGAFLGAGAVR